MENIAWADEFGDGEACTGADEGSWFALLNLATPGEVCAEDEPTLRRLVAIYTPTFDTYVNLSGNAAFIVLRSQTRLDEAALAQLARKLRRDLHQILAQDCSILIGDPLESSELIAAQARQLAGWRTETIAAPGIVIASHIPVLTSLVEAELEVSRRAIIAAIENRDAETTSRRFASLAAQVFQVTIINLVYLHYLLYDLITRAYQSWGLIEVATIRERIEQASRSRRREELSAVFTTMMTELAASPPPGAADSVANTVQRVIENQYASDLNLNRIAAQVHLSPAYL
ncbi:MAG: hypothetical protein LBE83_00005, partial [Propionibacteriaceae bacterium]|nr:hypothetical protein [Propionibacteriaceae bacterium]